MPNRYHMSWVASTRRWKKMYRGKMYTVSCRQLGTPDSKEGSWRAANDWWEGQQGLVDSPSDDERISRARQVSRLVEDFGKLDDDARRQAVEALLGVGSYDGLKTQAAAMLSGVESASPERSIKAQVEAWRNFLRVACQSGQMSEGRFDAYSRKIEHFSAWAGDAAVDSLNEATLDGFFAHLTDKLGAKACSPVYAHELLMTAKQFIRWLAERKVVALPGNIDSRRFRFNHSAAKKIEVFTAEEVRELIDRAPERTRLFLLLMLNCGMYQNDIAELRSDEVDWQAGLISRKRSKTRERNAPTTTYKLWPETFAMLSRFRAYGELALTTERGNPLVQYALKGGKLARYDAIQSAYNRMGKGRLGLKHFRKTSATLLGEHTQFKYFAGHFLADSPKGMDQKHYVRPNDVEFFEALEWLRRRFLGSV